MWLSQQSSVKEKIYGSEFGEEIYTILFIIFLVIEYKISPNFELYLGSKYLKFVFENYILE